METIDTNWAQTVHRFWFEELKPEQWFRSDPAIDAMIRSRFLRIWEALVGGVAVAFEAKPVLAKIIVLDQFSRNMFRGTPQAFSSDPKALELSQAAIHAGFDTVMSPQERMFLYMPFQHSEDRAVQCRSIELVASLGMPDTLKFAEEHKRIIDRFGRFPHRNAILGRVSTDEELAYLRDSPPSFG